ncbi:MAG: thiazole synthase [Puniceicoccales bacterium]|jgi:thiazole synthase|nr:thiazole synthase [Puniceicoccales bacterium]
MLRIADRTFQSRLLTGSGKYASGRVMADSLAASGSEIVTVSIRRIQFGGKEDPILDFLDRSRHLLLPNTSGVRDAREAVFAAQMAREALGTNWLKLEIHPDPKWLMPDPVETLHACEQLVALGFVVLPYIHADPVLAKRLEAVGAAAVMPLGAPIGSNLGLRTRDFVRIIIEQASVPVIVDAGLGTPSHVAEAMELGADAVLVNTALATAADPVAMGRAFKLAAEAGRLAYESGLPAAGAVASATSPTVPLTAFLG